MSVFSVYLIKFLHILFAMGLIGITSYCLILIATPNHLKFKRLSKTLLLISSLALLSGALLVKPLHYTFHTPWIKAAVIFLVIFFLGMLFCITTFHKIKSVWIKRFIYIDLLIILLIITHDAVTKSTFAL